MFINWKPLTALKLTKTLRRNVLVYTLNLFRLVIVLKLIGQSGLFLKTPMVTLITTMTSRNTLPLAKINCATAARSLGQYSSYLANISNLSSLQQLVI